MAYFNCATFPLTAKLFLQFKVLCRNYVLVQKCTLIVQQLRKRSSFYVRV